MSKKTFLVEIGTEELPSKVLRNLAESFVANFTVELDNIKLPHGEIRWFATSRRLALKVFNLADFQSDYELKKRGPSVDQAFDTKGKPSKEAERWAYDCGITVDQAEYMLTDKGKWLFCCVRIKGESAEALLPNIVSTSLGKLPIQKLMRWGAKNVCFVRPIHTITLLLGDKVVPTTILGIKSDRVILGHHFIGEQKLTISHADQYQQFLLEHGKVIVDYEERKAKIRTDIEEISHKIGGDADLSDDLLEEVTSLVEWPVVLTAQFEEKFLTIPTEILVHIMKSKLKYFPVYTKGGKLLPHFIFVANIASKDPQRIISGNEKVVRARLADAEFFFNTDRKKRLEDYLPYLKTVLFHQKLGSLRDKTDRIQLLAGWIAVQIGANVSQAIRAGVLAKCDLITNMVCEFTDIQGVVGMHYARYDGENENVSIALKEQYQPRFANDVLPSNPISCSVAIADKMDTLAGIFGIGQYPKGNKDPFALRRAALSILRFIIENNLNLDLRTLTEESVSLYGDRLTNTNAVEDVINFMFGRLFTLYQNKGYSVDIIQAVLARRPTRPIDFEARIEALSHFCTLEIAKPLITMNKRISNILMKSNETLNRTVCLSMLREREEINLFENLTALCDRLKPCLSKGHYHVVLIELSTLQKTVDNFFENVMVNVNDRNTRINRLALLARLRELFLQVADISLLQ